VKPTDDKTIPTLDSVFTALPQSTIVMLELKDGDSTAA